MKALAEKLHADSSKPFADEKGPFNLFALFLREDAPDVWDLRRRGRVDRSEDQSQALAELSKRSRIPARRRDHERISRVVIVERANPTVKAIASALSITNGVAEEVANSNFFGLAIKHAFIIAAQLTPPPNSSVQRTAAAGGRR